MKQLENLPEMTEEMLGGLHVSDGLREEILQDGRDIRAGKKVKKRNSLWQTVPFEKRKATPFMRVAALSCSLVFVVALLVGIPRTAGQKIAVDNSTVMACEEASTITTQTAGGTASVTDAVLAKDLPKGSITITNQKKPSYRGIWAAADGANFPLICAEGRYYRMLTNPTSVDGDLIGSAIGTVSTCTNEPALASGGIISNVVAQGETVYAVSGMSGAMVAANVNGSMRVFQRVSFGNTALKGGEGLNDTLKASDAVAMELTDVGTVTDAATAQGLYQTLIQNASLTRSGSSETGTSLLIQLRNGLTLQLAVRDESVMACGTWECPEFFEAFQAAVQ